MEIVAIIYFLIIYFAIKYVTKYSKSHNFFNEVTLKSYFTNLQKVFLTSSMTLYSGDKSGENFLIAVKFSNTPISSLDLSTIYDVAERYHLHSKLLLCNQTLTSDSPLYKKSKEYEIQILNSANFMKLLNGTESDSVLTTSDTSDDVCDIDEPTDPIQNGAFNTHGIFSIFKDKPDRL